MKAILLISIGLIAFSSKAFSQQCPQAGLKIQSADCEAPGNLMANDVSCKSLQLKWRGNKNQAFVLKTAISQPATNNIIETESILNNSCDDNGNCSVTIPITEGTGLSWSLQTVCSIEGVTLHSAKVEGPDAYIPLCEKKISIGKPNAVHVYPNPAAKFLMVTFDGRVTGIIEFRIFDITGKMVYNKPGDPALKKINNQYKLDLRNLTAGTYMLEVHNGSDVNKTKFVLLRK